MTIAAAGAASGNQMLLALLNRLSASSTSSSATDGDGDGGYESASAAPSTATAGTNPAQVATGPAKPGLTSDILRILMMEQAQSSSATSTSAGTSGSSPATDPAQALFNAMDTNRNGSITQSELENYIQAQGGTQSQADQLYAQLDPNNTGGISETTLASALKGPGGGHHHHGMPPGGATQTSLAQEMMQAMDSNGDGSVSQSEFTSYVTQNGGSTTQANALFSAFNTNGSGSLTQSDFQKVLQELGVNANSTASNFASALATQHANPFGWATSAYSSSAANTNAPPATTSVTTA